MTTGFCFFKVSLEAVSEGALGRRYLKKVEHFLLKTLPDAIKGREFVDIFEVNSTTIYMS